MEKLNLKAQVREAQGKAVRTVRLEGKIPAVLYGHGTKNINLMVDYVGFQKVYNQAGESTLVDLTVDEQKPVNVIINDVQLDPVTNRFVHIDFHQVKMDEKIKTNVEIKFVGEAPAIKEFGCILVTQLDELEIECLPADLVHEIEVDLSGLKKEDDMIHVSDVKAPSGVHILNQADAVIAMVQVPKAEKEPEVVAAPVEGQAVEGQAAAQPAEEKSSEEK